VELHHLISLLLGHGLPNVLLVVKAFNGPHHFVADHVAFSCSLSTGAPPGASTSATTLLGGPSRRGACIGNSTHGGLRTVLLGVNGQSEMRDHVTNQGGEPRSISLNDALGDEELAIFTVLGDRLEECTDLVVRRHGRGETSNRPLVDDVDMLVELGAVLVPVLVLGLPFIPHFLDYVSCEIALKAGSVNAHELALAGKIGLAATLLHLALPGSDKLI